MKRVSLAFILCLLFLTPVYSQTLLSGVVVNSKGEPLPFATVYVLQDDKLTVVTTSVTSDRGLFKIPLRIDSRVKGSSLYMFASYLSSKSDTVLVDNNYAENLRLEITGTSFQLAEVTIDAQAPTMIRKPDRFVFKPNKLLAEGASALDVLAVAPLIQFDNKNEVFSIVNKEETLVYINNKKSNMPREMIVSLLRSAPAEHIKDIEIITNPGSEYPANSAGGVININMKRMPQENWSGNIMVGTNQSVHNTSQLNGAINHRKGKLGLSVSPFLNRSFNYYTAETQLETVDRKFQENKLEKFRRYLVLGGALGLDYDIAKSTLISFNGFVSTVNGNSDLQSYTRYYTNGRTDADSIYSSPIQGKDHYIYNFGNVYFQHSFDSARTKKLTVNIDYNQLYQRNNDFGMFQKLLPLSASSKETKYNNILPRMFSNISKGADYALEIDSKSKINVGGELSNTSVSNHLSYYNFNTSGASYELEATLSNEYKYRENYGAAYLSYSRTVNAKLQGVIGFRAEYSDYTSQNLTTAQKADSTYTNLFPNLSLAYQVNKKSNLSASFSKKIRRPQFELLFPGRTYYDVQYFTENNPFLQPVIAYNYDFMYAYNYKYFFSVGYSSLENQFAQFIRPIYQNGEELRKKTYMNYGSSNTTYISFFTSQKFFRDFLDMKLSANVNFSEYRIDPVTSENMTGHVHDVNYNFFVNNTYNLSPSKKWLAFTIFKYNSPVENISFSRENALYSLDLGVRKTIKNISLNLYISDLFNTNKQPELNYHSNAAYQLNNVVQNNYTRSVAFNIRYSFGNHKLNAVKNKKSANEDIKSRIN